MAKSSSIYYSPFTIHSLDAERLDAPLPAREAPHEDGARDVDGREQVGQQPEHERDGEAADGPRPEDEEEGRRDDGGDVRVDDRHEGAVEAQLDGRRHGLARLQLLADALEEDRKST